MESKPTFNKALPLKSAQAPADWANRLWSLIILLLIIGFGLFIVYYLFTASGGGSGL